MGRPLPGASDRRSAHHPARLRAGVLEDGIATVEEKGTGQGSVISPLLSNVYLHYVYDLWAERWRRREATGDMIMVRYADDIIVGFQHESDARRFWNAMRDRLAEFSLSLHPDKTRLIAFGRFAAQNCKKRGRSKPETFKFLGFVLICDKCRRGVFRVRRKSRRDRMRATLREIKGALRRCINRPNPRDGQMACERHLGLFRLSRRADQCRGAGCVSGPRHHPLAPAAVAPKSAGARALAANGEISRRISPKAENPSSVAQRALRRQTPEVGAVCGNSARTDLCGGRSEMSVPTAIMISTGPHSLVFARIR